MPWAFVPIVGCFVGFGVLTWIFPCNRDQHRFWPKGFADDILYYFVALLFYGALTAWLTKLLADASFGQNAASALDKGYGWMLALPVAAQAFALLFATDFAQYWLHRLFHKSMLWHVHAVHHSAEQVNWTTTYRIHPLNYLVYNAFVAALTKLMGFSPAAFAAVAGFNIVHSGLVHANLNWTFGPFRYVLASPVFHRWHHSNKREVRDKNFAPTFPILDVVFGTFHMPRHELPSGYGAKGVPDHFLGQMAYPFRAIAADLAARNRPPVRPAGADVEG